MESSRFEKFWLINQLQLLLIRLTRQTFSRIETDPQRTKVRWHWNNINIEASASHVGKWILRERPVLKTIFAVPICGGKNKSRCFPIAPRVCFHTRPSNCSRKIARRKFDRWWRDRMRNSAPLHFPNALVLETKNEKATLSRTARANNDRLHTGNRRVHVYCSRTLRRYQP